MSENRYEAMGARKQVWRTCRKCHRKMLVAYDDEGRVVDGGLARAKGGGYSCVAQSNCRLARRAAKATPAIRILPPRRVYADGSVGPYLSDDGRPVER